MSRFYLFLKSVFVVGFASASFLMLNNICNGFQKLLFKETNAKNFDELPPEIIRIIFEFHECKNCLILKTKKCKKHNASYHPFFDHIYEKISPLFTCENYNGELAIFNDLKILNKFVVANEKFCYCGSHSFYYSHDKRKIGINLVSFLHREELIIELFLVILCGIVTNFKQRDEENKEKFLNLLSAISKEAFDKKIILLPITNQSHKLVNFY